MEDEERAANHDSRGVTVRCHLSFRGSLILTCSGCILTAVMRMKRAIAQAAALVLLGTVAGLVHNGFSANGIDPFRKLENVPVYDNGEIPLGESDPEDHDGICYVSFKEFREIVDAGYPIIDARTSDDYESGHIPGAILCDYFEMGRYFETVLPRLNPG